VSRRSFGPFPATSETFSLDAADGPEYLLAPVHPSTDRIPSEEEETRSRLLDHIQRLHKIERYKN